MTRLKHRWILIWALLACLGATIGHQIEAREPAAKPDPEPLALQMVLKDGSNGGGESTANDLRSAPAKPLEAARTAQILKMFTEALETQKDRPEFFKRPASLPAPRSATPVKLPFPPAISGPTAPDVASTPLQVLSMTPEGATERAPRLAISFNTPMIAVSDPASAEVGDPLGITVEPRPQGAWRWLGTQTVIFEPENGEFPRATEYTVTVPASTANTQGQALGQAVTQSFVLPRPQVVGTSPSGGSQDLEPLLAVSFDQPIVNSSALAKIQLKSATGVVALRQLTLAEAEARQAGAQNLYKDRIKDTFFLFAPKERLTAATSYTIAIDSGVESQEGPLKSDKPYSGGFSTYHPLKLSSTYPPADKKASPFDPLTLSFNNNLDRTSFEQSFVTVKPAIEGLKVRLSGSGLILEGPKSGNTSYQVTVSGQLRDTFGQSLGDSISVTLATGQAPKTLFSGFEMMTVLDPTVAPSLPLYSTNIDKLVLVVNKVEPKDWTAYQQYVSRRWDDDKDKPKLPGTKLTEKTISLKGQADALSLNQVDLSEYLPNGKGNVVLWLKDPSEDKERYRQREILTWVQGTKLGLDLEVSHDQAVALVSQLKDGQPVAGATVRLDEASGTSQADGTVVFPLPSQGANYALVETSDDQAFLPPSLSPYSSGTEWKSRSLADDARWFLFDDRGLYKPGETAHLKGYVRQWTRGPQGQLTGVETANRSLNWTLNDPRGNKVAEGQTELTAFGTVDFTVTLPPDTNLGNHSLSLTGTGIPSGSHRLNVQEFRRPEFEVTTEVVSETPHLLLGSATIKAKAAYYAGGSLAGSDVSWQVSASASSYTPPGQGEFTFGRWTPWWDLGPWWRPSSSLNSYQNFQGQADSAGEHLLGIDFTAMYPPQATSVTATASVSDVNRQQRSGSSTLLVHPSERYIGLKTEKSFVDEASDFRLEAIVSDIDGNIQAGVPMAFTLFQVVYDEDENGQYRQMDKPVQSLTLTSQSTPTEVVLAPKEGGSYRIRAEVSDAMGRPNRTDYTMWKAGGLLPTKNKVELESLTLVPDRKLYEPGQTANLLVMSPFSEGEGLVVWSRDGLLQEERFTLKNGTATIERILSDEMIPNLHAQITVVGKAPWGQRERPAIARGEINFSISKASRSLAVEILPVEAKLEPGAEVELQAIVKDNAGRPVAGSEVTLWMADEALLGLVGYDTPTPLNAFYTDRPSGMSDYHLRPAIALGSPELSAMAAEAEEDGIGGSKQMLTKSAPMRSAAPKPGTQPPPSPVTSAPAGEAEPEPGASFTVRKNFDALAVFRGDLKTDASGRTKVKVKLPDNLTRYRIFSVAIQGEDRFGSGDQVLTARLPVMVRPSLPRFLNFGDRAQLPVVVQNQTDKALTVEVVGEATGVAWVGPAGKTVTVPANDRVEVRFEAQADQVGIAHFRFGAVAANGRSDAATLSLPVYTPASGEAFATYGSIADKEGAISQPVQRPSDIWTQFGGLQVSLSSTALSELTDAFLYLYVYPYECAEQKASRVLSIAALREVLEAFNAEGLPAPKEIEARMAEDLGHLGRLQNTDGGWGWWRRDNGSVPFVSLHVAHAMTRAKLGGYTVDANVMQKAISYLREIEAKCKAADYGPEITRSLTAYALYIRELSGDADLGRAKSLFAELKVDKDPNLEALGWIWPTLVAKAKGGPEATELKRIVLNRATETADKAQFSMSYGEGLGEYLILHSNQRTDAILLQALLIDDPANALNTKLVRGLLAQRVRGRWQSTQENVWVLLALQKYFRTFEKEAPDFIARVWMEGTYLGEETFQGRSGKEAQVEVPMAAVPEKASDLVIGKTGLGRLYYRVGMTYAPKSLRLPAESRGFTVERKFRGLDNPEDVSQNEQGDWTIKAGAKVEVELTMVATERRYHVALVDPLPAGLEPLNPSLLGTPPVSTGGAVKGSRQSMWWWRWYEHENLRDERAEVFAPLVYPGVYTYKYTALATTPGEYILPPTKAEEMYSPEVYGRTATGRLQVVDATKLGK